MKYVKHLILPLMLLVAGCNTAPKGDYPRTHIDRPYSLPDDVAKISASAIFRKWELQDAAASATGVRESDDYVFPSLVFENGINDSLSWIYPIGVRWRVYSDERHTVGLTLYTLFFTTYFSGDYWFRVNEWLSLRPYYRVTDLWFFFYEETTRVGGLEFMFQANKYWAFSIYGEAGKHREKSELLEIILTGITGIDANIEVEGDVWTAGASTVYSLGDRWDATVQMYISNYDFGFPLQESTFELGFNYYW